MLADSPVRVLAVVGSLGRLGPRSGPGQAPGTCVDAPHWCSPADGDAASRSRGLGPRLGQAALLTCKRRRARPAVRRLPGATNRGLQTALALDPWKAERWGEVLHRDKSAIWLSSAWTAACHAPSLPGSPGRPESGTRSAAWLMGRPPVPQPRRKAEDGADKAGGDERRPAMRKRPRPAGAARPGDCLIRPDCGRLGGSGVVGIASGDEHMAGRGRGQGLPGREEGAVPPTDQEVPLRLTPTPRPRQSRRGRSRSS